MAPPKEANRQERQNRLRTPLNCGLLTYRDAVSMNNTDGVGVERCWRQQQHRQQKQQQPESLAAQLGGVNVQMTRFEHVPSIRRSPATTGSKTQGKTTRQPGNKMALLRLMFDVDTKIIRMSQASATS